MAIDKKAKHTFDEWCKIVADNANMPVQSYQQKLESKIEKKNENPSAKGKK